MADFAELSVAPDFVGTYHLPYAGFELRNIGSLAVTSQAFPTINLATYVPITVPWQYTVRRVWWINGSAAGGNVDFGIYSIGGTQIYHTGSTVGSGNSAPQFVSPTEFTLPPGRYYFALNGDNTTANRITGAPTTNSLAVLRMCGVKQQAVGALALPASATFAAASVAFYPFCGITQTSSGF